MQALPPSCPKLPDLPPLFWTEVAKEIVRWQKFFKNAAPGKAPADEMRKICIASIKLRLKGFYTGKNAGCGLFEMALYVACLTVIESRN